MIQHNLDQGSPAWIEHRKKFKNGSDAPAMLGLSKYKTRTQLLDEMVTGIYPEVDEATQKRFDDGHTFEALARPLAEAIIDDELSPVTGSEGEYGASFDGLTFNRAVSFEHKSLNNDIRACESVDDLDEMYLVQMEHGFIVSGAKKCLFMASSWGKTDQVTEHFIELDDGRIQYYKLIEEKHFWYLPNAERRQRIIDGWAYLDKDRANHVPAEKVVKAKAEPIIALPAVVIQVKGELTESNLLQVLPKFDEFLSEVAELKTDDDLVNGKARAKKGREFAQTLKLNAKQVTDQIMPVGEAVRMLELYADKFNKYALALEKQVDEAETRIKNNEVARGKAAYAEHVALIEKEIAPIRLVCDLPEFQAAIKGVRSIESLINRIDTCLNNGKIAADAVARDIRAKQAWFAEHFNDHTILFPDLQSIIYKPFEDFNLAVNARVNQFVEQEKAREAKRIADAAAIEAATQAKAAEQAKPAAPVEIVSAAVEEPAPVQSVAHEPAATHTSNVSSIQPKIKLSAIELFMQARDFGKNADRIRAVLVEFEQFQQELAKAA
jgi:predicted phage-related endonuclease